MKKSFFYTFLIIVTAVFITSGCGKDTTNSEGKKDTGNEKSISTVGNLVNIGVLMATDGDAGAAENNEGVGHYKEGHWKTSAKHFKEAITAGPKLAEAHYNLALTLDKMGDHGGATQHFKEALELAPDNPKIKDSKILKAHLGM